MKFISLIIIGILVFMSMLAIVYMDTYSIQKLKDKETDINKIQFGRVVLPKKER